MIKSNPISDKNYYAVRPELVLQAAKLFAVTPSMLEKGAKKLYSRAVAVNVGKQSGRWGRHQKIVLEQFCKYTQMTGSDLLLPWQELIESSMNYDGKEGISPRTGNKPLSTILRVEVNIDKLKAQRSKLNIDLEKLSGLSAIPVPLLKAIESGEWVDVAESTAKVISDSLGTSIIDLFNYVHENPTNTDNEAICEKSGNSSSLNEHAEQTQNKTREYNPVSLNKKLLLSVSVLLLTIILWSTNRLLTPNEMMLQATVYNNKELLIDSLWHVTVELENKNIPIEDNIQSLWSNGVYIQLKNNDVIAYNWMAANSLIDLPNTQSNWKVKDELLIIDLGGIVYKFAIPTIEDNMVTFNTTRAFKMTIHRITLK